MLSLVAALALSQLPPGFESRQNGRRLSQIQQGTIDCRPPLSCVVRDTTLSIYQGAASDLSCVGCVSDAEIMGVSGSKVTGAVPTATALAANPTDCTTGQYAKSIDAQGNLTCEAPAGGSTPNVTCAADEALTWNGSAWGCVAKVRAAYMADAGITAQTAGHATTADSATTAGSAGTASSASTATSLASNPTDCSAGQYAKAIDASGNLTCEVVSTATSATSATTATTAGALSSDPSDCAANQYATGIAANGNLSCGQVAIAGINATGSPSATTYLRGDGTWATPSGGGGPSLVSLTSNYTNSTTGFTDVTGLSWSVSAATYGWICDLYYSSAATTTAVHVSMNGPTTSALRYNVWTDTSATAKHSAVQTAYDTVTNPANSAGATALAVRVTGNATFTASGTLIVRAKSEINASAITILAGSWCRLFAF